MGLTIQDPSAGSKLQRLFKLVGRVQPSLEQYIYPVVLLEDLSQPGHADEIAGGSTNIAAGGAGTYGVITLVNPADSRALVLIDKLMINHPGATANFSIRIAYDAPVRTAYCYYRDTRQGTASKAHLYAATPGAVTGNRVYQTRAQNGYSSEIEVELVLTPGTSCTISCDLANTDFRAGFLFRERALP